MNLGEKGKLSLLASLRKGILLLDGAMGSLLLTNEAEAASHREHPELLNLSAPDRVRRIHRDYIEAGAEILTTNSFNLINDHAGPDRQLQETATASVILAREAVDSVSTGKGEKSLLVAASIGPAMLADLKSVEEKYGLLIGSLVSAGADLILIETILSVDTALAALRAVQSVERNTGVKTAVWVSAAIDNNGVLLGSRENFARLIDAVFPFRPDIFGLNCVAEPATVLPYLRSLSDSFEGLISFHPSAGLPAAGKYPASPENFADQLLGVAQERLVDIIGGCCGTTPQHIRVVAGRISGLPSRTAMQNRL